MVLIDYLVYYYIGWSLCDKGLVLNMLYMSSSSFVEIFLAWKIDL